MTGSTPPNTVVLIHGTCMKPLAWENWVSRYAARGYHVVASAAPLQGRREECVRWREDCTDQAAAVAVTDYYERILRSMTSPPILIGHCFGGLVVQFLLDRGLGAAGVAISSPPAPDRQPAASKRAVVAEPAVDYRKVDRAPLLLVANGRDWQIPPELVAAVALRYQESDETTGYLEYPQGCHHALRTQGWEQMAADILDWAELFTRPGIPIGA